MKSVLISSGQNSFRLKPKEQKQFILLLTEAGEKYLEINLAKDSQAEILGLILGSGHKIIKLTTKQCHQELNSQSHLFIKSILSDQAQFNFTGLIRIDKEAQLSDAYQRNENLLLSENVKCETKPYLEILANNVRCTHGATLGTLDREQLFYLQTRALGKNKAAKLLVEGFINSLLDKISDLAIVEILKTKIRQNLHV